MRILIPILAIVVALLFAFAIPAINRNNTETLYPDRAPVSNQSDQLGPSESRTPPSIMTSAPPEPNDGPTSAPPTSESAVRLAVLGPLKILSTDWNDFGSIGSIDTSTGYKVQVITTHYGAGVASIRLTNYKKTVGEETPFTIQTMLESGNTARYPFALRSVTVNSQTVHIESRSWKLVEGDSDKRQVRNRAVYEIEIADSDNDQKVLRLRRTFSVAPGSYQIRLEQEIINLIDAPLQVVLEQSGQVDLPEGATTYMGDKRSLAAGYFDHLPRPNGEPPYDPRRIHIYTDNSLLPRSTVLDGQPVRSSAKPLWRNEKVPARAELAWLAAISRYFTVVIHPLLDENIAGPIPSLQQNFPDLDMDIHGSKTADGRDNRLLIFNLRSRVVTLDAHGTEQLDLGIYAGPRKRDVFDTAPYKRLQFGDHLIVYSLGGMCTFCTFQWLAKLLLGFMTGIHFILRDWGLAIIVLVLFVRLLLHPITKKSQIQISKFQKQFAALQPEIDKLKKKYGDNQQKIQQEQMKLFREKGINPMNMLGCLPMFLQMPIWIALYAMLFLAIELRHEHAFYGIFQALGRLFTGKPWAFLADLSESDKFIQFADGGFNLFFVYIPYSLNILPILMGIFFFLQTKLTTAPPPNEQARQQQRIMMIMMVTLFPLMLYPAPCGLTLYIMASSLAGMVDSLIVRKHIKRMEADGTLFEPKKKAKSGGFMDRIQQTMQAKQQAIEAKRRSPKSRKPR